MSAPMYLSKAIVRREKLKCELVGLTNQYDSLVAIDAPDEDDIALAKLVAAKIREVGELIQSAPKNATKKRK